MFDVGFSEILVIFAVALIVLGPERLPKVARTVGHLFARMQRYVSDVKADITREMEIEELRKLQATMQETAQSIQQSVQSEMNSAQTGLKEVVDAVTNEVTPPVEKTAESTPQAPQS